MKNVLWEKGELSHGSSTSWTIFEKDGKIYVDSHAGWISEGILKDGVVVINPINAVPKYVKTKLKHFLKNSI